MTDKTISTTEARKNISKIMDEVEAGKASYTITRNQQVVAKLVSRETDEKMAVDPKLDKYLAKFFTDYDQAMTELAKR